MKTFNTLLGALALIMIGQTRIAAAENGPRYSGQPGVLYRQLRDRKVPVGRHGSYLLPGPRKQLHERRKDFSEYHQALAFVSTVEFDAAALRLETRASQISQALSLRSAEHKEQLGRLYRVQGQFGGLKRFAMRFSADGRRALADQERDVNFWAQRATAVKTAVDELQYSLDSVQREMVLVDFAREDRGLAKTGG